MESLKSNTLIKIEPNNGYDHVNDGGFEALLDEFGPDNEDQAATMRKDPYQAEMSGMSEEITSNEIQTLQSNSEEAQSFIQANPAAITDTPVPQPNMTPLEVDVPDITDPTSSTPDQSISNPAETSKDPKKLKVDLKKRRRRTKRSLARAAALICANDDLSKLTVPITITKDPSTKDPHPFSNYCEVVVFPNDFPETRITEEQYGIVQDKFLHAMVDDPFLHVDNWCPRFIDSNLKDGAIYFTCVDITTRHWIVTTLPKLNLWPEAKLIAVDSANLLKLTRTVVWIKHTTLENNQILKLLEKQNEGIVTSKWVIHDRSESTEEGVRIIIGIDEDSISVLREMNGKPFLGLGQANFNLPPVEKTEHLQFKTTPVHEKFTNKNPSPIKSSVSLQNKPLSINIPSKAPFTSNLNNSRLPSLNVRSPIINSGILSNINSRPVNRNYTSVLQPRAFNLGYTRMNTTTRYPNTSWQQ